MIKLINALTLILYTATISANTINLENARANDFSDIDNSIIFDLNKTHKEIYCLAINVFHEARGEPFKGKLAVAEVVKHRVESPQYPDTYCKVVRQATVVNDKKVCQFSWVCAGKWRTGLNPNSPERRIAVWRDSVRAALLVHTRLSGDVSKGATHFYATRIGQPRWAKNKKRVKNMSVIGNHTFLRIE